MLSGKTYCFTTVLEEKGNMKNKAPGFTKALVTVLFLGDGAGSLF